MKTTLELPDDLMRAIRVRAACSDRRLKDVVEELLRRGMECPPNQPSSDPIQRWRSELVLDEDGQYTNPKGIEDEAFFDALAQLRDADREQPPRDPFSERG